MASSKAEDVLGEKWDRCVADALIKIGGRGLLLLRRAMAPSLTLWNVVFGTLADIALPLPVFLFIIVFCNMCCSSSFIEECEFGVLLLVVVPG